MTRLSQWTCAGLLIVAGALTAPAAAQGTTNVAARANNPLAQGYASDGGYQNAGCCVTPNGPLDGNTNGSWDPNSFWHSAAGQDAWWYVDLGAQWNVSSMTFYNRTDCCAFRSINAFFQLWTATPDFVNGTPVFTAVLDDSPIQTFTVPNLTARYASVHSGQCPDYANNDCPLNFPEVEIQATPEPVSFVLMGTGLVGVGVLVRRKRKSAEAA